MSTALQTTARKPRRQTANSRKRPSSAKPEALPDAILAVLERHPDGIDLAELRAKAAKRARSELPAERFGVVVAELALTHQVNRLGPGRYAPAPAAAGRMAVPPTSASVRNELKAPPTIRDACRQALAVHPAGLAVGDIAAAVAREAGRSLREASVKAELGRMRRVGLVLLAEGRWRLAGVSAPAVPPAPTDLDLAIGEPAPVPATPRRRFSLRRLFGRRSVSEAA